MNLIAQTEAIAPEGVKGTFQFVMKATSFANQRPLPTNRTFDRSFIVVRLINLATINSKS